VGINGFGRIGRLVARFLIDAQMSGTDTACELVHVNELHCDVSIAAYLLQFDSIHGKFQGFKVEDKDGQIEVTNASSKKSHTLSFSMNPSPEEVDWAKAGVTFVLDCTGEFTDDKKLSPYFDVGIKRVLVSAPTKGDDVVNVVVGCNDDLIKPDTKICTAASCTTNCIAPVIKVVDSVFGIEHGSITTIHNVTNTQSIMDAPNLKKSDPRRARSGMLNLAPTSTGSAKAITVIFPHLKGKLNGVAVRVPLQNGSITDLTLELKKKVTAEQVNEALEKAADDHILGFEKRMLVSTDFINDARSSIVDAASTMVIDHTQVKILAWYDNEYGYSRRMYDIAQIMAKQML